MVGILRSIPTQPVEAGLVVVEPTTIPVALEDREEVVGPAGPQVPRELRDRETQAATQRATMVEAVVGLVVRAVPQPQQDLERLVASPDSLTLIQRVVLVTVEVHQRPTTLETEEVVAVLRTDLEVTVASAS